MFRTIWSLLCLELALGLTQSSGELRAQDKDAWVTIKGRIVWGGNKVPVPEILDLKQNVDKPHCEMNGKLTDESLLVDAKTRGIKNVIVWLGPDNAGGPLAIHPALAKIKDKTVVIDQPVCQFVPRVVVVREGQVVVVKNSSPKSHNIKYDGNPNVGNPSNNITLVPGASHTIAGLVHQKYPMPIACGIHGWMAGRVAVFDHPYFAITGEDGGFEIKLAPTGKVRVFALHETLGWHGGVQGAKGTLHELKAGAVVDVGDLKMQ